MSEREPEHLHRPAPLRRHAAPLVARVGHPASTRPVPARPAGGRSPACPGTCAGHVEALGQHPGRGAAAASTNRNAMRRPDGGSAAAAISAPITCGAAGPWRSSSRIGRGSSPASTSAPVIRCRDRSSPWVSVCSRYRNAMRGTVRPSAGVVDEPVQRVELLLVEPGHVLGDHRAEQHAAERRTARGQVAVVERDASGRHVPSCVADVQLGEQHVGGLRQWFGEHRRVDVSQTTEAGPAHPGESQIASMIALKRGARAHGRGDELVVGEVVATDVDRRALHRVELVDDLVLVGAQRLGDRGEARRQLGVVGLCRQLPRPVEREVEVAAAVVELVHLARRRAVLVEHRAGGAVERVGEQLRGRVVGLLREELERRRQREELAERVPAEVVLLHELLHVLGRRTAGTGLEQATAVHERHDREHLGAGAELHDREQVGEVVAQHVAGDRDGVLAPADALERVRGRRRRARGSRWSGPTCRARGRYSRTLAMICASCARVSSSQNTTCAPDEPAAQHREAHPVADRRVLHLTGAPDVARLDLVLQHHVAGTVHDAHRAVDRDLERLVVRAVLLGLLRHEPDVGHRTHRRGVERAVGLAVVDDRGVDTGVATSRG